MGLTLLNAALSSDINAVQAHHSAKRFPPGRIMHNPSPMQSKRFIE